MNRKPKPTRPIGLVLAAISLVVSITAIALHYFPNKSTIVYVDAQKLVSGYKGMQEARKEFELKAKSWQSNLDTLRMELEAQIKEYEVSSVKLSLKEKALTEELIRTKQEQYMNYREIVSEKVKKEDQELTSKVLNKVNDYVKRYGEEKSYSIIMAATQFGNIVYAEKGTDITEEVLQGLNLEYGN